MVFTDLFYRFHFVSLQDTTEVVKKFMARDPESLNFTVVALAKA